MLPASVKEHFAESVASFRGLKVGVLEVPHRSEAFLEEMADVRALFKDLLAIPSSHEVLMLHGGARRQFAMIPQYFLPPGEGIASYISSGHFSEYAIAEARTFGRVDVPASGAADAYGKLPDVENLQAAAGTRYVHYTSNNTEFGTQFAHAPAPSDGAWLVSDASSDLLTRPVDWVSHDLVYSTTHKNLGTPGLAVVVVRRDLPDPVRPVPQVDDYRVHLATESRHNTPPLATVHVLRLMLEWSVDQGGLEVLAQRSTQRSAALYDLIDRSEGFYRGLAAPGSRSAVNVTFALATPELERRFVVEAEACGMVGLLGYRRVGHLRASLFNPVPQAGVDRLINFMKEFRRDHG
ncbi:3-phosphoserine/phosphohydroxythreonine transaminase [Myceligenerans halotolerans]